MSAIYARAIGVLVLLTLVLGAFYGAYHHGQTIANDQWQAKWDSQAAERAQEKAKAEADARAEEQRRIHSNDLVAAHARDDQNLASADAAGATASTGSVQHAAQELAGRSDCAAGHSTLAGRSPPTNHAAMVLSDLLTRANQRAADLAAYADRARIAGQTCEASYDALFPK